ncbi:MAG: low specificity L-threonine aldolase, partial [Actinobacteria bacterium]|nr:low specificity L-threonine aldolase [Actinomycetota bacterium]
MIDLRSDTVTRPSPEMRAAIAAAPVGDDVYGDDPTVNSLEERVAELFGMEAALFTPTGSLANQLAIRMLVAPGEELLCETTSHIARAELGAAAVFSGITTRTWPSERGLLRADDPLAIAHPNAGPYLVSTTAIAIENTHNFGGGTVQSIDEIKRLRSESKKLGISLHLDGARIWNAHVATQVFSRAIDLVPQLV